MHVFAKAASLEDICEMLTNDPKLLWGGKHMPHITAVGGV